MPKFSPLPDQPAVWDSGNEELALVAHVQDEVHTLNPPPEGLRCAACRIPILIPTLDGGHCPVLWRLAHCRHPLHLDCLAPLGRPYAISRTTQRPYYVHNPGSYFSSPPYEITLTLTF
jgi:hypothetical protein